MTAKRITIFYSWQSDLPNSTNRGFIEQALEKAIKEIKAEADLVVEPVIGRDVLGTTGTPDISQTIFDKIDQCHVFVGDVSIINPKTRRDRKTPNPNVLAELGYAVKTLTWDNVICVYNTAFGGMRDLPFHLQGRLMCSYAVIEGQPSKAEERDKLASKLRAALKPILERIDQLVQKETAPKPLTPDEVASTVKDYLADFDRHRIKLSELVTSLGRGLASTVVSSNFPMSVPNLNKEHVQQRVQQYEEISQVAVAVMAAGCRWGKTEQTGLWTDLLQLVANPPGRPGGQDVFLDLLQYPALLLLYAGGIAAVAGKHYGTLLSLLTEPKLYDRSGYDVPLHGLNPHRVMTRDRANDVWSNRQFTPVNNRLEEVLRRPLRTYLPEDRDYGRCFDRFEFLWALLQADNSKFHCTVGCFGWREPHDREDVMVEVNSEANSMERKWPPFLAGWFGGDLDRFRTANEIVRKNVADLRWRRRR